MVIHQFNKLIRNKWVWGAFALAVSAAFCFDDLFTSRGPEEQVRGDGGTLSGEAVDAKTFLAIAEEARGFGRSRDWKRPAGEVNRSAWETYAALKVAKAQGLEATDAEVQAMIRRDPSFQMNGAFSFKAYQLVLRENGLTPERFEEYLKRRLTLMRFNQTVLASATWASPMELDQALSDMTDTFTVKVAKFEEKREDSAKVKVGEKEIKKWYDENVKSLALPERCKIRYVKFDATDKKVQARMTVTEDEMRDRYDVTVDKYTSTDTNGVETVKKFEEVKGEIEKELRLIAAVQFFETNLNQRAYAVKAAKGSSRLDEIAKEEGLKVKTSDYFTIDGAYQEGFMKRATAICPGATAFNEAVAELDSSSEDLRYAVVTSDKAVWLIEKAEVNAAHTPTFEEAKKVIEPRVLKAAKAEAFKTKVEAIAKGGAKAVEAVKDCSTNIVFSVCDLQQGVNAGFDNAMYVARAAMGLKKGEVSDFTLLSPGRAILVVCEDRVPGDAAKQVALRLQVQNDLTMLEARELPENWQKWNLERLGFEPGEINSTEIVSEEE